MLLKTNVGTLSFLLFRWRYSSIQSLCYALVIAGMNVIETEPDATSSSGWDIGACQVAGQIWRPEDIIQSIPWSFVRQGWDDR